jgi:hypothetical protein
MSNERNREFIRAYVKFMIQDDLYLDAIVDEAMQLLTTKCYLYISDVNNIIDTYYPERYFQIIDWSYNTEMEES